MYYTNDKGKKIPRRCKYIQHTIEILFYDAYIYIYYIHTLNMTSDTDITIELLYTPAY